MDKSISKATRRNWRRLDTDPASRLAKRANKRASCRKFIPVECLANRANRCAVQKILDSAEVQGCSVTDMLCSVAEKLFEYKNILHKPHVRKVLGEYPYQKAEIAADVEIPFDEPDLLGVLYQSRMTEGVKNQKGSYFTPLRIARSMTAALPFGGGQTFLDPCCGSGAFLLSLPCDDPELLYGADNDPAAVMIAKFNLLLRFPEHDFLPHIVCGNFLTDDLFPERYFDYIVTNPPWGAVTEEMRTAEIRSGESSSFFFVRAFRQVKENGIVRFLLPEAVLNVKIHEDLRTFTLKQHCLKSIVFYGQLFSGVVTGFVDIECQKNANSDTVYMQRDGSACTADAAEFLKNTNTVFRFGDRMDSAIIDHCCKAGRYTLKESIWALGIVTGNNKEKLKSSPAPGLEAVFTGREIAPYTIREAKHYILYDRKTLQQTARDEYYRAPEKLVYKFISEKLVFACDDRQRLFLNSANILIPHIPGMSIKTVMALLNSELFSFLYKKMFGEVKILKGNLLQLPFPQITTEQDEKVSVLADRAAAGDPGAADALQEMVWTMFALSPEQIGHIRQALKKEKQE